MAKIELTRRRILGGLVTIGAGSAAAGAGTFALFSDTETSNDNTLSAGTLDLQAGSSNTLSFSASDIVPTDTGTADTDLEKSGTIAADLSITVTDVSSAEGDTPDSETNTDTSDGGELDDQLELDIWLGTGGTDDNTLGNGDVVLNSDGTAGSSSNYETAANYSGTTWSNTSVTDGSTADNLLTDFSGPVTFNVDWRFPDLSTNNAAQGDDITVDFEFELVQQS